MYLDMEKSNTYNSVEDCSPMLIGFFSTLRTQNFEPYHENWKIQDVVWLYISIVHEANSLQSKGNYFCFYSMCLIQELCSYGRPLVKLTFDRYHLLAQLEIKWR